mgnify:CR=1 FL=1
MPNRFFVVKSQEGVTLFEYALIKFFSIKSQKGVTMIEYALIAALVAVVVIAALSLLGTNLTTIFTSIATTLGNAAD